MFDLDVLDFRDPLNSVYEALSTDLLCLIAPLCSSGSDLVSSSHNIMLELWVQLPGSNQYILNSRTQRRRPRGFWKQTMNLTSPSVISHRGTRCSMCLCCPTYNGLMSISVPSCSPQVPSNKQGINANLVDWWFTNHPAWMKRLIPPILLTEWPLHLLITADFSPLN